MALQAYIDDSKTGEEVLVLAGYISAVPAWEVLTVEWDALLKEFGWAEFKMKRAISQPERAERFYRIVEKHVAAYVACVVEIGPLRQLCDELSIHKFFENPYNYALRAMLEGTYRSLSGAGLTLPLEFIFDDRGEKKWILAAWDNFLAGLSAPVRGIVRKKPRFEDSAAILPLQAAEIIAWCTREHWLKHGSFVGQVELPWAHGERPVMGHLIHWDYAAMKPNMLSLRQVLLQLGLMTFEPAPRTSAKVPSRDDTSEQGSSS